MLKTLNFKLTLSSTILGLLMMLSGCLPSPTFPEPGILDTNSLHLDYMISYPSDFCNGDNIKIEVSEDYPTDGENGALFFVNGQAMRKKEHFIQVHIPSLTFLENSLEKNIPYNIDLATRSSKEEGHKWKSIQEGGVNVRNCNNEPFPIIGVRPNWADPKRFNLYLKNAEEIKAYLLVEKGDFTQEEVKDYFLGKASLNEDKIKSALVERISVNWEVQSSDNPTLNSSLENSLKIDKKFEDTFEITRANISLAEEGPSLDNRGAHVLANVEGLDKVGKATINFDNQYAFSAKYGIIRAPSTTNLTTLAGKSVGTYAIESPEKTIDFHKVVKESRPCDPTKDPFLEEGLTLEEYKSFENLINHNEHNGQTSFNSLNSGSRISGKVPVPFKTFTTPEGVIVFYAKKKESGDSICGVSYYFIGTTKSEGLERRGEAILHFDAHINPYLFEKINFSATHVLEDLGGDEGDEANEFISLEDLEQEKTSIISDGERQLLLGMEGPEDSEHLLDLPLEEGEPQDQPIPSILSEEDLFYLLGNKESVLNTSEASPVLLDVPEDINESCFDWSESREGKHCDFSEAEWGWVVMPSFVVNAKKGDIFLTTGCDLTSHLLNQVDPPQRYPHTGIMTENHYKIRHSIGSSKRAISHVSEFLPPKIPEDILAYFWPGTIDQIITKAVDGQYFKDPANENNAFRITGINPFNHRIECRDKEIFVPIIIKPPPEEELDKPRVRSILHDIADEAKGIKGFYSLYDFSNFEGPKEAMGNSDDWFNGRVNAVCSTFIRLAAIGLDSYGEEFTLEGETLEALDLKNGAQGAHYSNSTESRDIIGLENKDGLYFYDKKERRIGAKFIHSEIRRTLIDTAFGGNFGVANIADFVINGLTTSVPNQFTNCFVLGQCEPLGPEDPNRKNWEKVGEGLTVSPDDLLFWDKPSDGGVYGYHEPIEYSPKRFIRIRQGKWVNDN